MTYGPLPTMSVTNGLRQLPTMGVTNGRSPLPIVGVPSGRRRRIANRPDVLALASLLLDYPDDALCALRSKLSDAVGALPRSVATTSLRQFLTWFDQTDPDQLRVDYVRTFDHKRRSALYVTFAEYGDTRARGAALSRLREYYRALGFSEREGELPDYLPTVLQFAALADVKQADEVLNQARFGIVSIRMALEAQHSPYAAVLKAIEVCLPARPLPMAADVELEAVV